MWDECKGGDHAFTVECLFFRYCAKSTGDHGRKQGSKKERANVVVMMTGGHLGPLANIRKTELGILP